MTKVQISVTLVTIFSLELVLACTECSMLPVPYQLLPFFLAYLFVYVHPLNIIPSDKVKQQEHDKRTLKKNPQTLNFTRCEPIYYSCTISDLIKPSWQLLWPNSMSPKLGAAKNNCSLHSLCHLRFYSCKFSLHKRFVE